MFENKLLWKIYKKEASELKVCSAGFSRVFFVYLLTKEFKTVQLGNLPPTCLRECRLSEIKVTKAVQSAGWERGA